MSKHVWMSCKWLVVQSMTIFNRLMGKYCIELHQQLHLALWPFSHIQVRHNTPSVCKAWRCNTRACPWFLQDSYSGCASSSTLEWRPQTGGVGGEPTGQNIIGSRKVFDDLFFNACMHAKKKKLTRNVTTFQIYWHSFFWPCAGYRFITEAVKCSVVGHIRGFMITPAI